MRIPRIYLPLDLENKNISELTEHAFQHAVKVLRMKENSEIIVFDGIGNEYRASLQQVNKKNAFIQIKDSISNKSESKLYIHLGLGFSKGDRMDFAIQKAVELGVTEITPLLTEHSVINLDEKRMIKRLQHWHGIIVSACEQSGRNVLPKLNTVTTLIKWSESIQKVCLIFDPLARKVLKEMTLIDNNISLVIGPEGGLSGQEISELKQKNNFHAVKFGNRILRTETAAISAITALQLLWGDLNN